MTKAEPIALVGGTLVDGSGKEPIKDAVVVIIDNAISQVGRRKEITLPQKCHVLDVAGKTLMPGMMDLHVHLGIGEGDSVVPAAGLAPGLGEPLALRGIRAFTHARRALEMGFTTLRDVGDFGGHVAVSVRNAVKAEIVEGPRILVCGEVLTTTGGHVDFTVPWLKRPDGGQNTADGVEGVLKAVRRQIRMKCDWIKFFASGSAMDPENKQEFNDDELKALIEEAHTKEKPVCAHCGIASGTLAAVKAGLDSVEHGMDLTEEILDLMIQMGTYLVPTINGLDLLTTSGAGSGLPAFYVERLRALLAGHVQSFQRALEAGVKIACGSDAGFNAIRHGNSAVELEYLVKYGMTPMQAIVTATSSSAAALRLGDKLGTIEPGKLADIVVIDGNPLADIKVLQDKTKILLVMKEGSIYVNRMTGSRQA